MNRREFLKKTLEGIAIASIPFISCSKNPVSSELNSNSFVKENIEYYTQTDKKDYKLGENVEMLYRVTNLKNEDVTFGFPTSKQYHFRVMTNGTTIWEMSKAAEDVVTAFTLKPNGHKEFNEIWSQVDEDGNPVGAGKYDISGELYLFINHKYFVTVRVSIEIKP